ncbi:MAG: hypothetical protein AB7E55_23420 [Pigmentiphaga sp.]
MESRGRKSSADLAVVTADGLAAIRRPDPPNELTGEQAHEWRCVVNRLPAEWFPRETHGMLAQYCRHVVAARRVAQMIQSLEDELSKEPEDGKSQAMVVLEAVKAIDRLYKMQEREGRAISSLATRMRISQQSTLDREKKKPLKPTKKPWD